MTDIETTENVFEAKARGIVKQILDHDIEQNSSGYMIMTIQMVDRVASALEAVERAIIRNTCVGGPVQVIDLQSLKAEAA